VDRIGYALTYPTTCFITGDFVLLDSLGPPWAVHECYYHRTPNDGGPRPGRSGRDQVRAAVATMAPRRVQPLEGIGTSTAIRSRVNGLDAVARRMRLSDGVLQI
jgi:hypothetical protein